MIRLTDISRIFRMGDQEVRALNGVDLEIGTGEYVSIMGPSGAGKSTLLNLLCKFYQPSVGKILLDGRSIHERAVVTRTMPLANLTGMTEEEPLG